MEKQFTRQGFNNFNSDNYQNLYISAATKATMDSGLIKDGHVKAAILIIEHGIVASTRPSDKFGQNIDATHEQICEMYKCIISMSKRLKLKRSFKEYKKHFKQYKKGVDNIGLSD